MCVYTSETKRREKHAGHSPGRSAGRSAPPAASSASAPAPPSVVRFGTPWRPWPTRNPPGPPQFCHLSNARSSATWHDLMGGRMRTEGSPVAAFCQSLDLCLYRVKGLRWERELVSISTNQPTKKNSTQCYRHRYLVEREKQM